MSYNATINFTISKSKGVRPSAGHESSAGQSLKMHSQMSEDIPLRENYILLVVKAFAPYMTTGEKNTLASELTKVLK